MSADCYHHDQQYRRSSKRLICLARLIILVFTAHIQTAIAMEGQGPEILPENYAESVMIGMISEDGSREISLRLARFPEKNSAHIWLHFTDGKEAWSLVDENFILNHQTATPVAADRVVFDASKDTQQLSFQASQRNSGRLLGLVTGNLTASATRFPRAGEGDIATSLNLTFAATGTGFRSNSGRWEMTGTVQGDITLDGRSYHIEGPGKWHEQTGPRARFAPAFTYLNLQNEKISLLAIGINKRTVGYAIIDGVMLGVADLQVAPEGPDERQFSLNLLPANGEPELLDGTLQVTQRWSVPIEGTDRPGSTVVVNTAYGVLSGSLNDWKPAGDPR
ncbi:MAG: hypothetical protein KDI36_06225 [Pseudomonadales bacterium]|nr:hypothetical protein [Pseudomonadales bacterium]